MGADLISPWRLKALLAYDPVTGFFTNRTKRGSRAMPGTVAGNACTVTSGETYWEISIEGQKYFAHRLAWFYVHGTWPDQVIHKDGSTMHNAIANLKSATKADCQHHSLKALPHGTTGRRGVAHMRLPSHKKSPYSAKIKVNMQRIHLGSFSDPDEAELVYLVAKHFFHGPTSSPH